MVDIVKEYKGVLLNPYLVSLNGNGWFKDQSKIMEATLVDNVRQNKDETTI